MKKEQAPAPLTGEKLLKTAINKILAHPETWNQSSWHSSCGTKHCIAGWCQLLAGKPANGDMASSDSREAIGISHGEASWLFAADRTLPEIYSFAEKLSGAGYNRAGYNRAGYNRAGYNRAGYNRAGYDRDGKQLTPFEIV